MCRSRLGPKFLSQRVCGLSSVGRLRPDGSRLPWPSTINVPAKTHLQPDPPPARSRPSRSPCLSRVSAASQRCLASDRRPEDTLKVVGPQRCYHRLEAPRHHLSRVQQRDCLRLRHSRQRVQADAWSAPGKRPPQQLADTMHAARVAFATNGDSGWPAYDLSRRATIRFDTTSQVVFDPRSAERTMWEGMR